MRQRQRILSTSTHGWIDDLFGRGQADIAVHLGKDEDGIVVVRLQITGEMNADSSVVFRIDLQNFILHHHDIDHKTGIGPRTQLLSLRLIAFVSVSQLKKLTVAKRY